MQFCVKLQQSVAASASIAGTRDRRRLRLHSKVVERAVQLAPDLVEQLLASNQIVCEPGPASEPAGNMTRIV